MFDTIKRRLFGRTKRAEAQITEAVANVVEHVLRENANLVGEELGAIETIRDLRREVRLQEDKLNRIRIQQKEKEREIEHKLGLHKLRVEAERELAEDKINSTKARLERHHEVLVREAKVVAREEAMEEATRLMEGQMERMEKMVDTLVGALPKAEIMTKLTNNVYRGEQNDG